MKKTYNNPSMRVISIHVSQFLASSTTETMGVKDGGVSNTNQLLGRDGWFDEGEE